MITHTSEVRPTIDRIVPSGSGLRHGPLLSGISITAAVMASAAIGMFSRKTEPHQKWLIITPPSTGPPTRPTIATTVHAAIALRRSASSVNTVIRIDSVLGISSAPPMPIATRAAISSPGLCASVATADAMPNSVSPMIRTLRRPNRSDRLPVVSSRPANTRM